MPYLEDTLEEAEANDCSADEAAGCELARAAAGSAATKAGKT